jgi:hypothetical protein
MRFLKGKSEFLLEREFESIIYDITSLYEDNVEWIDDNTVVWSFDHKTKLQKFLSKLDKEQIKKYFKKFTDYVSKLPSKTKKRILLGAISTFLLFASSDDLLSSDPEINNLVQASVIGSSKDVDIDVDMSDLKPRKAEFSKAQEMVKQAEGGYTDDQRDSGNWVDGRLVGTNHGISAPELKSHLGRTPTKQEMEELSYEDALEIYENKYWKRHNLSHFNNQSVANLVYDGVVNQGQNGMKKVLQKVLSEFGMDVKLKNIYDVETIDKMNELDQEKLFNEVWNKRWDRYQGSKNFKLYGNSWKKRLDEFSFSK